MQSGIHCMLMRGGTSKGAYLLASDLPSDEAERDDLLLRIMGSPDERQIDGVGGAHPLTSKVAIISPSTTPDSDIDFLFVQVGVKDATVDTTPNCGNILAGVGPFALERGLLPITGPVTRVRVKTLNTGTLAELVISTPNGSVCYEGNERIDGVPGTSAAIPINFLETEGSVCGSLLPTGNVLDVINGVDVTCIDNGMPVVLLRAEDVGLEGSETPEEIEAATESLAKIEAIRLEAGRRMGLGDVSTAVVPKMTMVSRPRSSGAICTRTLIPRRCHTAIGVFGALSVATASVLPGSVAHDITVMAPGPVKVLDVEHPTGFFAVRLEIGGTDEHPVVERGGFVRTARALFDGVVFPRPKSGSPSAGA